MAYDAVLAEELRELLADEPGITEQRMFGGLAFLHRGRLAVAASHTGGLLVRVAPGDAAGYLAQPHVEPMEMRERPMPGWLRIEPPGLRDHGAVAGWVERSLAFVRTLPPR
jgi:hypothetical protein